MGDYKTDFQLSFFQTPGKLCCKQQNPFSKPYVLFMKNLDSNRHIELRENSLSILLAVSHPSALPPTGVPTLNPPTRGPTRLEVLPDWKSYPQPSHQRSYRQPSCQKSYPQPSCQRSYPQPSHRRFHPQPSRQRSYPQPSRQGPTLNPNTGGPTLNPNTGGPTLNSPNTGNTFEPPPNDSGFQLPTKDLQVNQESIRAERTLISVQHVIYRCSRENQLVTAET